MARAYSDTFAKRQRSSGHPFPSKVSDALKVPKSRVGPTPRVRRLWISDGVRDRVRDPGRAHRGPSAVHGDPSRAARNLRSNDARNSAEQTSNQRASCSAGRPDTSIPPPTCNQDRGMEAARRRPRAEAAVHSNPERQCQLL